MGEYARVEGFDVGLIIFHSLLLQPMQFLPAFEGALQQLIANIHEPNRHDIQGKECRSFITSFRNTA